VRKAERGRARERESERERARERGRERERERERKRVSEIRRRYDRESNCNVLYRLLHIMG
jgi:hypothetical protein